MALETLRRTVNRDFAAHLFWDAPHNLVWPHTESGTWVHRKGATPAYGISPGLAPDLGSLGGEPVIVPGAMGASSWVLAGTGSDAAIRSACHGAGRLIPRRYARLGYRDAQTFVDGYRVVTPVDPVRVMHRPDIHRRWLESVAEKTPDRYKDVGPVIETLRDSGIAVPVARLSPLVTFKA